MSLRNHCLFTLVACGIVGLSGCATFDEHGFGPPELSLPIAWTEIKLPKATGKKTARVHVTAGDWDYRADYGPDPMVGKGSVQPVISHGGSSYRQIGGFFYLWEHWLLFETDRVRTITWGTDVIGRIIEGGYLGDSSPREQFFVLTGNVVLLPKDGGPSVLIKQGQYVVVSGDDSSGIAVTSPTAIPQGECKADPQSTEDDIICFLAKVKKIHETFGEVD